MICEEDIEMMDYDNKIKRVLYTEEEVRAAIKAAGKKISEKYDGKALLLVGFLKGSFVFLADLLRAIDIPCEVTYMAAKVLFPDDKDTNGTIHVKPDRALFETEDCFVIGCGMDCSEYYRNLPYLAEYDRG